MTQIHSLHEKPTPQREEYISRINKVIDYIDKHLDEEMTLETLARVASFSRFHFHRIFAVMIGETLNQFINRLRLEKAATQLLANPKKSITEIALDCGFSGSAAFARAFKEKFAISASEWRQGGWKQNSNIRITNSKNNQTDSKNRKEQHTSFLYIDNESITNRRFLMNQASKFKADVQVTTLPEMTVAYVRYIGPYKGDEQLFTNLFNTLFKWAEPRGLLNFPETLVLSVYHDNPDLTDESKLRVSACITVKPETPVDGQIGKMTIPGGRYAKAKFELNSDEFQEAWTAVCGDWLPDSGYQPDEGPSFEIALNDCREHPEHKHIVEICIPVKPL